ncbi:MAG: SipW-dependent-type signal peptide-containing protein [Ruminococcus sp.]|nr:SipW-dependent-type signal peptide-containing protein [Ruminococcus sp.]
MKKKGKALLLCTGAVALVAGSVLGTIAFLTDTEEAINTFTVGNVSISIAESKVDENGVPVGEETTDANEYRLVPGVTYTKDPTVTVDAESEDSYVRMILNIYNKTDVQAIIDDKTHGLTDYADLINWDKDTSDWLYEGFTLDEENDIISFEFRYKEIVDGYVLNSETQLEEASDVELQPLFTELIVPGTLTNTELENLYNGGFKIVVEGQAIQATGFTGENAEDDAWEAFDKQHNS